ncbi:Tail tip assembly protein I [Bordetella tumbae]|uniref:tail assembly protein n=1 Tax=Bordetella tumbae TaxID=1649139 RepID=UPI0039EED265
MSEVIQPTEKLRTIRLYGDLGSKFGREHKLYVSTPAEAIRALCSQIEGFDKHISNEAYRYAVLIGKRRVNLHTKPEELHEPPGDGIVRIAPIPAGAKRGGLFQTILGVALIATAWFNPLGLAAGSSLLTGMMSVGVGLTLGGIAQLLSPQPKLNLGEGANNKASQYFSGPAQTVPQGNPVPIFYGRGLVGSVPISAGIYAENSQ